MPALTQITVPLTGTDGSRAGNLPDQISGYLYCTDDNAADTELDRLIVMMHGWGADSTDLTGLAEYILPAHATAQPAGAKAMFFPDAPYQCSANPFGREWFALSATALDADEIRENCAQARWILHDMADSLCERFGLSASQLVIGGFSQGGMMALAGGLSYHSQFGGLFCLSGGLLSDEIQPYHDMAVLLVHGDADPVVPADMCNAASQQLSSAGFAPETHIVPGLGHGIDQTVINRLASFISR